MEEKTSLLELGVFFHLLFKISFF